MNAAEGQPRIGGTVGVVCCPAARIWTPLAGAGLVLGAGFAGLADGIILHQILGWHHLICLTATCQPATIAALQRQNTQDGYFHLALWLVVLAGTALLWRAARAAGPRASGRELLGGIVAGGGLFDFFEGLLDHQLLGIHHVLPGPHQLLADLLYLAFGLSLLGLGLCLLLWPAPATVPAPTVASPAGSPPA